MSYSAVHIFNSKAIRETNGLLRSLHRSKDAFQKLMVDTWGDDSRYTHKQFVADFKRGRAKDWTIHHLAQHLLNSMPHDRVSIDFSLRMALAEGQFLPTADDLDDDEGFASGDESLLAFLHLLRGRRSRKGLLSDQVLVESRLMKKLSGRLPLPKVADTRYPMWALAAADYYQGYLTVREMKAISPDRKGGYFDYMQRALKDRSEAMPMGRVLEQLRDVREKLLKAGTGSVCVSVEV